MSKLKITVEKIDGYCNQPQLVGNYFIVDDGKIIIPVNKFICMWALSSMMPIFPVMLREKSSEKGDWITKKEGIVFTCPDPKGKVHYRIERIEEKDS